MAYIHPDDDCPRTQKPLVRECRECPYMEYYHGDAVTCLYGEESEEDIAARHAREDAAYIRDNDRWREMW